MAMMTYSYVSKLLNVPIGTLYAYVSQDKIPHVRLGGRLVRFKHDEIEKWVEANTVRPGHRNTAEQTTSKGFEIVDIDQSKAPRNPMAVDNVSTKLTS